MSFRRIQDIAPGTLDYNFLLGWVMRQGEDREDRTGVGTRSIFGAHMEFDLQKGFPLVTEKKVHWKSVLHELLWFISGSTNVEYLQKNGVSIWDEWADENGDLGPVYGYQWRSWRGHPGLTDQLGDVIKAIKENPYSRRHIVSAWNVGEIDRMALPPCHVMFQFYVSTNGFLDLQMYQRSGDLFLGVPFNIASYATLLMMVAHVTGLKPRRFTHVLGDAHIYHNHFDQVEEFFKRSARTTPKLKIVAPAENIDDFTFDSFELVGYDPHPAIKAPVAV